MLNRPGSSPGLERICRPTDTARCGSATPFERAKTVRLYDTREIGSFDLASRHHCCSLCPAVQLPYPAPTPSQCSAMRSRPIAYSSVPARDRSTHRRPGPIRVARAGGAQRESPSERALAKGKDDFQNLGPSQSVWRSPSLQVTNILAVLRPSSLGCPLPVLVVGHDPQTVRVVERLPQLCRYRDPCRLVLACVLAVHRDLLLSAPGGSALPVNGTDSLEVASVLLVDQHQIEVVTRAELLVDVSERRRELKAAEEETNRYRLAWNSSAGCRCASDVPRTGAPSMISNLVIVSDSLY